MGEGQVRGSLRPGGFYHNVLCACVKRCVSYVWDMWERLSVRREEGKGHVTQTSHLDKEGSSHWGSKGRLQLSLLMQGTHPHTRVVCGDTRKWRLSPGWPLRQSETVVSHRNSEKSARRLFLPLRGESGDGVGPWDWWRQQKGRVAVRMSFLALWPHQMVTQSFNYVWHGYIRATWGWEDGSVSKGPAARVLSEFRSPIPFWRQGMTYM